MTPKSSTTLPVEMAQLNMTIQHLSVVVQKINESMEGTAKTPGMKEKIAIAQYNIEANKQAYQQVMDEVKRIEERIGRSMVDMNLSLQKQINDGFATLKSENASLRDADKAQATIIQKLQPWINGIAWFMTVAGGILISMLLNGKIKFIP